MNWVYEKLRDDLKQSKYNMKRIAIFDQAITNKINDLLKEIDDIDAEEKFEEKLKLKK